MITILKTNIEKVTHMLHLADAHIRSAQRHDEFREVFSRLYQDIKNTPETTIVVFAGDLLHQKIEISPESLQLASEFIKNIADIRPLIIIAGNHDAILSNKNRMDSITPIVNSLNHYNVYYLRETGLYGFSNILLNNMSVFDEPEKYILGKDIPSVYKNKYDRIIGLFHGAVDQSMSDSGHVLENPKIMLPLFDNHHALLLGDIHLAQNLQEYNNEYDKPIVRYAGSCISQNHSEFDSPHGYSFWDLSDMSYSHKELKNDYGFYTVGIEHGNLVTDLSKMPKNVRLRVICKETIPSEVKTVLATLKETHNIIESSFIRETADIDTTNKIVSDINLKNIFDVTYQNELIKKHLSEISPDISTLNLDNILCINQNINKEVVASNNIGSSKYKLIRMEWENMFKYGSDNYINFENVTGVNGIFAKNASGKSSALNCLLFCLFDKTSTSSKGTHVLNNQKSSFKCKLELEIDDIRYFIERKGTMGRTGAVKVDVRFWKVVNGEEVELHGTERSDTNEVIRTYVGTFDDFILTSAYFQFGKNNLSFIDMGNSDRKDILVKFIGIDVFDKLCKIANDKKKEINTELKIYKGKDYQTELNQTENAVTHATTIHTDLTAEHTKLKSELSIINQKIQEESIKLIKLDSDIPTNITELTTNKLKLEERISQVTKGISDLNKKSTRYSKYIRMVETSIKKIEALDLIENHKKYKIITDKISAAKKKMDIKKVEVRGKLDKVDRLKTHKYDPNCKFCIDNDFVKDAVNCQEQLKQDKVIVKELMEKLEALELDFENIKWVDSKYELYTRLLNKRGALKDELQSLSTSILNYSNNQVKNKEILTNIDNNIAIYNRNLTAVENNNSVNTILSKYRLEASTLEINIQKINNKITEIYGKLEVFKSNITNLKNIIELVKNKEIELNNYEKYISAVGRDGIPYKIICNAIPTIEKGVNDILTQITEFTLKLENDGSDIIPYISYEDKKHPIELCSGFERFIMELAIRVSLIENSNISKSDYFFCDEGMSALDPSNLSNMETLFSILKTKFSAIVIISHLSQMKDAAEKVIEINQVNGFSQIQHN